MNKVDLAYMAGLIDGEAYIGIKRDSKPMNGRLSPGYHERIQIRMVDEEAIAFIAGKFGGNYYKESPHCAKGRLLYCYQISDMKAAHMIKTILPYLKIKHRVARRVLELRKRKDSPLWFTYPKKVKTRWGNYVTRPQRRLSDQELYLREQLYLECKAINKGKM